MSTPRQLDEDVEGYLAEDAGAASSGKSPAELDREISDYLSEDAGGAPAPNPYEARQARRRERLQGAAAQARVESERAHESSRRVLDAIPFGQPILVGHHSERRHRRDLARSDAAMRKGIEASRRAKDLEARAAAVGTGGVSSDDPEAVRKLRGELAEAQKSQDLMKAANTAIRRHAARGAEAQEAALVALGLSAKVSEGLLRPDFMGRIGFAPYQITNNGANLRRIERRIADLSAAETAPARGPITGEVGGLPFTLTENKDENRTQVTFSGRTSKDLHGRMRAAGFVYSPTNGAYQRKLSNQAWHAAARALGIALGEVA